MTNKPIIALDIDDTITDLRNPMMQLLNESSGQNIHWNDWDTFSITDRYNMSVESFYDLLINNDILHKLVLHDDTLSVLTNLRESGYNLVMVTARGYHPDAYAVTKKWLDANDVPYDDLLISSHDLPKSQVISKYDNVVVAVDDNIGNYVDYEKSGRVKKPIIYDMPWNTGATTLTRIHSLSELYDHL